jgi:hypothetical protein
VGSVKIWFSAAHAVSISEVIAQNAAAMVRCDIFFFETSKKFLLRNM